MNELSFFIRWAVNVGIQVIAAPLFILSYTKSPSFLQPWFLGTATIALLGFLASLIFFGETIVILKILGAALALAGAVLLIL
jgi:ABC-type enterochelin transport system permease subunit